jgi:hypothetical protein
MAQRMVDGEQYEAILIKGAEDGSAIETTTNGRKAIASFDRPGDTTPYSIGDVVSSAGSSYVTFSGLTTPGEDVYITNAAIAIQSSTVPAGMGSFKVHFYSSAPSGLTDNGAFSLSASSIDSYQGYTEISSPVALGDYIYRANETVNLQPALASGSSSLYVIIQTNNGWTPASGANIRLSISYFPV